MAFATLPLLYHWLSVIKDLVKFQFPSCGRHFIACAAWVGAREAFAEGKGFVVTSTALLALATSGLNTVIFLHRDFGRPLPAEELMSRLPLRYSIDDTILAAAAILASVAMFAHRSNEEGRNGK